MTSGLISLKWIETIPTWNLMKNFERTVADYRDEIMSLTKSNNQMSSEKNR